MNLPEPPATIFQPAFQQPSAADRAWWWRLETESGDEVSVEGELADQRFATQADAESWVGEIWADLADEGVDAVTLHEHERVVYGPMSLHA